MSTAIILSADRWEMADENTGEIRRGVSIWYVNDYRDNTGKAQGMKPTKISAPAEVFEKLIDKLPASASLQYDTRPGREGKAQLVVQDVVDLKPVKLFA